MSESLEKEDKHDSITAEVLPVLDAEAGDGRVDDGPVIPKGVDPDLFRKEEVKRGLKERHIQVCLSRV